MEVEAHLEQADLPAFSIVGLADRACQEAKHRVHSGIVNAMLPWPGRNRITVNLAPAALRKEGSGFDLPIALALLAGSNQLSAERLLSTAASASCRSTGVYALSPARSPSQKEPGVKACAG